MSCLRHLHYHCRFIFFSAVYCSIMYCIVTVMRFVIILIKFYVCMYAIFGKVGRIASEEVILHLVKTKCHPILLHRLECYPLNKADTRSLDFAVTRFLMKMFSTVNMAVINDCRLYFDFYLT